MKYEIEVVRVSVAELRKELRARLADEKPLVLTRAAEDCAFVIAVRNMRYQYDGTKKLERARVLAEVEAVLQSLGF